MLIVADRHARRQRRRLRRRVRRQPVAETPNLDALADDSLRFERAVPEAMPAVISRRALLTGMRSYPFRDWQRRDGFAPVPGWNTIYSASR